MEPEDVLDSLESQVEDVEMDLRSIEDEDDPEDLKAKQEAAEDLLSDIHDQIGFLKDIVEEEDLEG